MACNLTYIADAFTSAKCKSYYREILFGLCRLHIFYNPATIKFPIT